MSTRRVLTSDFVILQRLGKFFLHELTSVALTVINRTCSGDARSQYAFKADQRWCPTLSRRIRFVDETEEVANTYRDEVDAPSELEADCTTTPSAVDDFTPTTTQASEFLGTSIIGFDANSLSHSVNIINQSPGGTCDTVRSINNRTFTSPPVLNPSLPWTDRWQAECMKHFATQIAPALDLLDPEKYFTLTVPRITVANPIIRGAVFAVSEKHLLHVRQSSYNTERHDSVFMECLNELRHTPDVDETILTALILLSFYEGIEGKYRQAFDAQPILGILTSSFRKSQLP